MASVLDLGNVGMTGVASGPHAHWTVLKDGKQFPLSKTRKDLGQYIEFRPPNEQNWYRLYGDEQSGFKFNPSGYSQLTLSSPMGARNTGIPGASTDHRGEDYTFPEGTTLRFAGQGSVATYAGQGAGGNVSSLRTGPYELQTMHLGRLPGASTTRTSDAPTPTAPTADTSARTEEILKAFMYGQEYKKEPKKTFEQGLKEQLVGGLISQALNPMSFLSSYSTGNPFLSGRSAATSDFLGGILG